MHSNDHDDERGPWCEDPEHCAAEARATVLRAVERVAARRRAQLRVIDGGLTASTGRRRSRPRRGGAT